MNKEKDIKYSLGNQDIDTSLLTLEATWSGISSQEVKEHVGVAPLDSLLEVIEGKTINYLIDSSRVKTFVDTCAKSLLENSDLLEELRNNTRDVSKKMRDLARDNIDKVEKLNDNELIDLLMEIKRLQAKCTALGTAVAFADIFGEITDSLIKVLKKRENLKHQMNVYTGTLGSPPEKSLTEKAYEDIKESKEDENNLLNKYFWLDQGYIGRGLTLEHLKEIKNESKNEEEDYTIDELRAELNLTKNEERIFEVSQALIEIKSLRADSRQFLHVLANKIIDRIAKENNVNPEYLEALYTEEICDVVRNKEVPKNLEERWKHSLVIPDNESYKILTGNEAVDFLKGRLVKEEIKDKKSVKGQVAYPGKVTEKVKLVFGPQHNDKIKDREIIISRATSPQLLPAMKRASAFITDVGGITSHAAIVAREMKKPCVVGTKHATEIFRDGDLVEVDADNGIVRKIEG